MHTNKYVFPKKKDQRSQKLTWKESVNCDPNFPVPVFAVAMIKGFQLQSEFPSRQSSRQSRLDITSARAPAVETGSEAEHSPTIQSRLGKISVPNARHLYTYRNNADTIIHVQWRVQAQMDN